ncbi:hypothetical protein S7711_11292 [Stachybotrys chartarum IBT 7711]|uniref:Uncharacterized protein n=1 Tax=Stachybotrys chartarum (strain CBS 109288 / IBT 7711) TaxID=1280523 RepID=A0A084BCK7_STACB|nr:hypothetical protein S7711_11292 [Stachybotrys chartarum IBT 7711]
MVNSKASVRKHNKKLNRNLQGLLKKEDFLSFESDEQHFGIKQITEKKVHDKTRKLSPEDVEKKLGISPPKGLRRKTNHPNTGQVSVQPGLKTRRRPELRSFPELPEFDMSVLKQQPGK